MIANLGHITASESHGLTYRQLAWGGGRLALDMAGN